MRVPGGLLSHTVLAVLTLLSAGAIALSLATAPPVAQSQLRTAAGNTAAASSFVLTDVNTVRAARPLPALGGRSRQTNSVRIAYQAPDRILDQITEASGRTVTLLVVGNSRFERIDNGPWTALPPIAPSGTSTGEVAASQLLVPLNSVAHATSVTTLESADSAYRALCATLPRSAVRSTCYRFLPGDEAALVTSLFGQQAAQLSSVAFSATIGDEFLRAERIVAQRAPVSFVINLGFSSVNAVPPIVAPSGSKVGPGR